MSQDLISICVPTYECGNNGVRYLQRLLKSIQAQTYINYEIVISDHSQNDEIKLEVSKWDLPIRYYLFAEKRGRAAANLNNAMKLAKGRYLKPFFQDDFFCSEFALQEIVEGMENTQSIWCGIGCNHTDDNETHVYNYHPPGWDNTINMAHGHNLLGSPSIITFRNDIREYFDEELIYFVDCELYYRLSKKFGAPLLINKIFVTIRMRSDSVSALTTEELKQKEHQYIDNKYSGIV